MKNSILLIKPKFCPVCGKPTIIPLTDSIHGEFRFECHSAYRCLYVSSVNESSYISISISTRSIYVFIFNEYHIEIFPDFKPAIKIPYPNYDITYDNIMNFINNKIENLNLLK